MRTLTLASIVALLLFAACSQDQTNQMNGPGNVVYYGTNNVANGAANTFRGNSNVADGSLNDFHGDTNHANGLAN